MGNSTKQQGTKTCTVISINKNTLERTFLKHNMLWYATQEVKGILGIHYVYCVICLYKFSVAVTFHWGLIFMVISKQIIHFRWHLLLLFLWSVKCCINIGCFFTPSVCVIGNMHSWWQENDLLKLINQCSICITCVYMCGYLGVISHPL